MQQDLITFLPGSKAFAVSKKLIASYTSWAKGILKSFKSVYIHK